MSLPDPVLTPQQIDDFMAEAFPLGGRPTTVESVEKGMVVVRLRFDEKQIRPGGTISGPSLMTLADSATYMAILAHVGLRKMAMTTNLNITFLRPPKPEDMLAQTRLLKLGRRLAVADVVMVGVSGGDPVAQATVTYSLPPDKVK